MNTYFIVVVLGLLLLSPLMLKGSLANVKAHKSKWQAQKRLKIAKRNLKNLENIENHSH